MNGQISQNCTCRKCGAEVIPGTRCTRCNYVDLDIFGAVSDDIPDYIRKCIPKFWSRSGDYYKLSSATIVSGFNYVVTNAHCVIYELDNLTADAYSCWISGDQVSISVKYIDSNMDIAIFEPICNNKTFGDGIKLGVSVGEMEQITSYGYQYPDGAKENGVLLCSKGYTTRKYMGNVPFTGKLIDGCSGGPVLCDGFLVGINRSMNDDLKMMIPIEQIKKALNYLKRIKKEEAYIDGVVIKWEQFAEFRMFKCLNCGSTYLDLNSPNSKCPRCSRIETQLNIF